MGDLLQRKDYLLGFRGWAPRGSPMVARKKPSRWMARLRQGHICGNRMTVRRFIILEHYVNKTCRISLYEAAIHEIICYNLFVLIIYCVYFRSTVHIFAKFTFN